MSEGCRRNDSDVRTSSEAPVYSNNAFPMRSEIPPMPMSLARAKTELMLAQERLRAIQKDVDRKMMVRCFDVYLEAIFWDSKFFTIFPLFALGTLKWWGFEI